MSNTNRTSTGLFDSEIQSKTECGCDTELMTLVGQGDKTNKSLPCKQHSSEEQLYNTTDEKRNTYRPLKFVQAEAKPGIPSSLQRIPSLSTDDDFTDDSRQLIKRQFSSPTPPETANNIKHRMATRDAVLELGHEEDTYEIMDTKIIPRVEVKSGNNGKNVNSITGYENRTFQHDENRLSIYETVDECKNSHIDFPDDQPNYETMANGFSEEQPNYETMETGFSEEQPNYETMETGFSEEQPNYETMETGFSEEQPNYEAMDTSYSPRDPLNNDPSGYIRRSPKQDEHEVYEIPVIVDAEESEYEIPEISDEFKKECVNSNSLKIPNSHGNPEDDTDYIYVDTSSSVTKEAREVREKFKGRKSWHSGEQPPKPRIKNLSGTRTIAHQGYPRQSQLQKDENHGNNEDEEELYSVAEHPKPSPEMLALSKPQMRQKDDKQVDSKKVPSTLATNSPGKRSTFAASDSPDCRKTEKSRTGSPRIPRRKMGKSSPQSDHNTLAPCPPPKNLDVQRKSSVENPNWMDLDGNPPSGQPLYSNLAEMTSDVIESDPIPEGRQSEDYGGRDGEEFYDNMEDETTNHDDQPLYENFVMAEHK